MLVSSRKQLLCFLATFAISAFTTKAQVAVAIREETEDADGINAVLTAVGDDRIAVEMTSTRLGFLAFGFSLDQFMANTLVVVGLPSDGTVLKYEATSYSPPEASASQTLEDVSIMQNDTHTVMKFTKLIEEEGEPTVDLEGANIFLYALGSSNTFGYHGTDRGSFDVNDLASGGAVTVAATKTYQGLWVTHGILMGTAWVLLIPVGVGVSVFRSFIPGNGTWFKMHRALNGTGLLMMIVGFSIAVYIIQSSGLTHFTQQIPHRLTGLIITIFGFIQGMWGAFRPHAPHAPAKTDEGEESPEPEPKTTARVLFEYGHRILGVALLGTAWYNTSVGLDLFSGRFGTQDLSLAMWIVVAILTVVTVGLGIKQRV